MFQLIRDFPAGPGCVFRVARMDRGYLVALHDLDSGQSLLDRIYPALPQAIHRARDLSQKSLSA